MENKIELSKEIVSDILQALEAARFDDECPEYIANILAEAREKLIKELEGK